MTGNFAQDNFAEGNFARSKHNLTLQKCPLQNGPLRNCPYEIAHMQKCSFAREKCAFAKSPGAIFMSNNSNILLYRRIENKAYEIIVCIMYTSVKHFFFLFLQMHVEREEAKLYTFIEAL